MDKNVMSHLIRRDVELKILEDTRAWDNEIYYNAHNALVEIALIINRSKNEEKRKLYLDYINNIRTFMDRNDKIKADLDRLTVEYNRLYARYAHQVELNRKLREEFTKD